MTREEDIKYEKGDYWVLQVKTGYEVYKTGLTHSTRCARIGWKGEDGLQRAIQECQRRALKDDRETFNFGGKHMKVNQNEKSNI